MNTKQRFRKAGPSRCLTAFAACAAAVVVCVMWTDARTGPSAMAGGKRPSPGDIKPTETKKGKGIPYAESFSLDYSVIRAFAHSTWGHSAPPDDLLDMGRKSRVDASLRLRGRSVDNFVRKSLATKEEPWWGLGVMVENDRGTDEVYRDARGTRLVQFGNPSASGWILSAVCKHDGRFVRRDLGALRTESGVGLGDTEKRLLKLLGRPSRQDDFQGYRILWYFGRPKHVVRGRGTAEELHCDEGLDAAYVLRKAKVVEIWLQEWDTDPVGG